MMTPFSTRTPPGRRGSPWLVGLAVLGACAEPAATTHDAPSSAATSAPMSVAATPVSAAPASVAPAPDPRVATGKALFSNYCALCHGPTAEGYAADNAPSLVTSTFQATASDAFLRAGITYGRPGTAMAGYGREVGGPLLPADVDAVIAYLRSLAPVARVVPPEPGPGDAMRGQGLYARDCATCHGTPMQRSTAVHLSNVQFLATASPAFLRYAIAQGRPGTKMEAWAGRLSPQEIDDLVAYIRVLTTPPPPPPVPPSMPGPPGDAVPPWGPIVLNPKGKPPVFSKLREDRYVSIADVRKAFDEKRRIIIVDTRAPSDYLKLHIRGALPLPYYNLGLIDRLPNDGTPVIAYCACPHHASGIVVDELRRRGFKNAFVLDEGVFAWQRAGHPVAAAPGFTPVPAPPPHAHEHGGPHGHDHAHDHGHGAPHPPH